MADEMREVMRYELDVSDVEAKARKMQELLAQVLEKQRAGQNTGEHEQALNREFEALGRSTGKTKEANDAIGKLLKSKRDMADVVSLLGGRFGSLIGDVGGVIELFRALGTQALGVTAALAGITMLTSAYASFQASAKAAAEAQERFNKTRADSEKVGIDFRTKTAETLASFGVSPGATPDVIGRVNTLATETGVRPEIGLQVAVAEQYMRVAGRELSEQDQAALRAGLVTTRGVDANAEGGIAAQIDKVIAAGRSPEAQRFAAELFAQTKTTATVEAPGQTAVAVGAGGGSLQMALDVVKRRHPDLTDKQFGVVSRIAGGTAPHSIFGFATSGKSRVHGMALSEYQGYVDETLGLAGGPAPTDAAPMLLDIKDIAPKQQSKSQVQRVGSFVPTSFGDSSFGEQSDASGPGAMVINNYDNRTVIGTQYNGGDAKYRDPRYTPLDTQPAGGYVMR